MDLQIFYHLLSSICYYHHSEKRNIILTEKKSIHSSSDTSLINVTESSKGAIKSFRNNFRLGILPGEP